MRMTLPVVAITLVNDAMSKTVSTVIGSIVGSSERLPNALRYITLPLCPTMTTAPGVWPWAIAFFTMHRPERAGRIGGQIHDQSFGGLRSKQPESARMQWSQSWKKDC